MDFPAYSDPGREDDARLTLESGLDGPRDDGGEGVTAGEEREGEAVGRTVAAAAAAAAAEDVAGAGAGAELREDNPR